MMRRSQARSQLAAMRPIHHDHHVVELDALAEHGPRSLFEVGKRYLDPARGTVVITEGLVNDFDRTKVLGMWASYRAFPVELSPGPLREALPHAQARAPVDIITSEAGEAGPGV